MPAPELVSAPVKEAKQRLVQPKSVRLALALPGVTVLQQKAKDDEKTAQHKLKAGQLKSKPVYKGAPQGLPAVPPFPIQKRANKTGLPDHLKAGVEHLSGFAMDDVKVHYNSAKPATLQAHAYAQGTEIHIAPGQEKHLPHEAWHVAQQKQGRAKPTLQMKGVAINDDSGLEREADAMGAKAIQQKSVFKTASIKNHNTGHIKPVKHLSLTAHTAQRIVLNLDSGDKGITDDSKIAKERQEKELKRNVTMLDDTWSADKKALIEPIRMIAMTNPDEPLVILAHGLPVIGNDAPQVANKTAKQLYNELVSFGFTNEFKGDIDLSNCTTAWSRDGQMSFAQHFHEILKQHGHTNTVTGFRSFVSSPDIKTEIEIDYDQRERALVEFMISRYLNHLGTFTIHNVKPAEKQASAAALKTGKVLIFQEARKQLMGKHSEQYSHTWYEMFKILEQVDRKGIKLTEEDSLDAQEKLMVLKMDIGKKGGAVKTVPAKKVVFKNPVEAHAQTLAMVHQHE